MNFHVGRYRWFRKLRAYRSDFCLTCKAPRIAEQYRTFDIAHLNYVPLLPLGLWKHWHCTECDNDPRMRQHTKRWVKVVGAFVFLIFAVIYWFIPVDKFDSDGIWVARAFFTLVFIAFVGLIVIHKPKPPIEEQINHIPSLDTERCRYCGGSLWGEPLQCEECAVYQL